MISFILFLFALPSILTLIALCVSFFENTETAKCHRWQMPLALIGMP